LRTDVVEHPLEPTRKVGNLEVDPRMDRVEAPGTGRGNGQNRCSHRFYCSLRRVVVPECLDILATASTLLNCLLHMQVPSKSDVAALLDRLVTHELPSGRGLESWDS